MKKLTLYLRVRYNKKNISIFPELEYTAVYNSTHQNEDELYGRGLTIKHNIHHSFFANIHSRLILFL